VTRSVERLPHKPRILEMKLETDTTGALTLVAGILATLLIVNAIGFATGWVFRGWDRAGRAESAPPAEVKVRIAVEAPQEPLALSFRLSDTDLEIPLRVLPEAAGGAVAVPLDVVAGPAGPVVVDLMLNVQNTALAGLTPEPAEEVIDRDEFGTWMPPPVK